MDSQPLLVSPLARTQLGLQSKIFLFLIIILATLALLAGYFAQDTLRREMTNQFISKGEAIATSLATSEVDAIASRDTGKLTPRVRQLAEIQGVAYVLVYDRDKTVLAHTFPAQLPAGLVDANVVASDRPSSRQAIVYEDPARRATRRVIDVGVPVRGGELGSVRVAMDRDMINAAGLAVTNRLLIFLGVLVVVALLLGLFFARRIVQPINRLVTIARRVGEGDLSELAPVGSSDEIGVLAGTFNEAVVRLRAQAQADEQERRQRHELQAHITHFLDVATEIAQGDMTRRGEVTADVLGSVVDAINLMVEEIGDTLGGIRRAADTVQKGAREMILSTDGMVVGAQQQSQEAQRVTAQVSAASRSIYEVSERAGASANAARQTQDAALRGQQGVDESLAAMQRIRQEVRGLATRIKSLGERSMEISEIVETISGIAAQTNLLALNAAIEASGAGEYGARFAVVASEVRKLAEDSAQASKRIATLIKGVQHETREAVVAMETGTREVETGFRVANQAGDRLREIGELSHTSTQLAEHISQTATAQAEGIERVAQAMVAIAEIASRTEKSVVDGRQAAQQLVQLAEDLTRNLARFKLAA